MELAHEKWFVDEPALYDASWSFALDIESVVLIASAVAIAGAWWVLASRLPCPELGWLRPLGRLAPWIPRLLGIHLGVSLLSLAVGNAYLAPNLSLDHMAGGWAIALAEGVLGVWLVSGIRLRPAALVTLVLGPLAWVIAGAVAMLEAVDLLGIALFLALLPPGRDSYGAVRPAPETARAGLFALRVCVGAALVVLSISEKFANPELAREFIDRYPAFDLFRTIGLPLDSELFIRVAGSVELLFGLLIMLGAAPQVAMIVAGIPFNATLFFLGRTELIGHLPIYGAMLALLVYGSSATYAREVRRLPSIAGVKGLLEDVLPRRSASDEA